MAGAAIRTGIGDDCAVIRLPAGHEALLTTDFSLQGVHFRHPWHPPEAVGHRCLARGLSDIAAMGGEPIAAFLSLALPRNLPQDWVERFLTGLLGLAARFGVTLGGGDVAQSLHGVLADIVVLGSAPRGRAVLRSGARPGDVIYVTGELGRSAAALRRLLAAPRSRLRPADYPRHFFPTPRIETGRSLRRQGLPSAMIDISDGLSTDLAHICQESGVGAVVYQEQLPYDRATADGLRLALHGGEDYELLFTAPAKRRVPRTVAGVAITPIGTILRTRRIWLQAENGKRTALRPGGWEHFRTPGRPTRAR